MDFVGQSQVKREHRKQSIIWENNIEIGIEKVYIYIYIYIYKEWVDLIQLDRRRVQYRDVLLIALMKVRLYKQRSDCQILNEDCLLWKIYVNVSIHLWD